MRNSPVKSIATHSGSFHADDVFATCILLALYPEAVVLRTRDPLEIDKADVALDVGGVWNPAEGRYDHHQKGFTGARPNGVVYASAGLVWSDVGEKFIRLYAAHLSDEDIKAVHAAVDEQLVQYLDMTDTGAGNSAPGFYGLSALVFAFNMTRAEDQALDAAAGTPELTAKMRQEAHLERFMQAVEHVTAVLVRIVKHLASELADVELVRNAQTLADGKILILEESAVSWMKPVTEERPDVLLVVYPDSTDNQYLVRTVPVELGSFTARLNLPARWGGLRDEDLAVASGVGDALFCHTGLFIAGSRSKEGAIALANHALSAAQPA
ncbi:MYG1 family protein [Burkholderia cenocepacia]|uniref:MYG1 family protein n=1 Tax=Burkholderia cenocepacia TaxID=95486 RepID=UPI0007614706|nr:MYG1 family protein [Burkholderia cenocepacia]KWU19033.1 hypothetical protein AS149_12355 [Burkholderia cenocepacia]